MLRSLASRSSSVRSMAALGSLRILERRGTACFSRISSHSEIITLNTSSSFCMRFWAAAMSLTSVSCSSSNFLDSSAVKRESLRFRMASSWASLSSSPRSPTMPARAAAVSLALRSTSMTSSMRSSAALRPCTMWSRFSRLASSCAVRRRTVANLKSMNSRSAARSPKRCGWRPSCASASRLPLKLACSWVRLKRLFWTQPGWHRA
mmetsp:Transcript_8234/g.23472  ORF Transcript_8234/g.23472 Transcript_8234/m.23472 type:complete len:206 (+) Transcript_8234:1100-1717(+)